MDKGSATCKKMEICRLFLSEKSGGVILEFEALHDDDGDEEGSEVASGQRSPHAIESPQRGGQQQHRQQEQQLAR